MFKRKNGQTGQWNKLKISSAQTKIVNWSLMKEQWQFDGESILFSTKDDGITRHSHVGKWANKETATQKLERGFTTFIQIIGSKWGTDLNAKGKTIKLPQMT